MQNPRKITDNPYLSHTDNHVHIHESMLQIVVKIDQDLLRAAVSL